jgi:long-subunit acyl-CoA synthetase (AMP-forming)
VAAALGEVAPWERVRKVVVLAQPLTVATDELTVSLKLRRQVIVARCGDRLEALYRE